jgi:hypothetical protein
MTPCDKSKVIRQLVERSELIGQCHKTIGPTWLLWLLELFGNRQRIAHAQKLRSLSANQLLLIKRTIAIGVNANSTP